jgi:alpha-amylase/alpha-mannosidase (GH57 family)
MTKVAILWHMHQPFYQDLLTGDHVLPWVRMHALKDYFGMVALSREFPDVRLTFNLVPSLLVQLQAFADGEANDHHLSLSLKPADRLTADDRAFIVANSFHAQRQRMIEPYARYAELFAKRERSGPASTSVEWERLASDFSVQELRDLQVWQKLAWVDPYFQDEDIRVQRLFGKGALFSEDDKRVLAQVERELIGSVIPEYRAAGVRGNVELSTSPFYHPILPLLCNSDVHRESHPGCSLPPGLFRRPEDAAEQLARAVSYHERLFGKRPAGLWPSEGSVSEAVVALAAEAGFSWMATDEILLGRSLGIHFSRDGYGHVEQPESLYRPYRVEVGGRAVSCLFRDHVFSDLIGFSYSRWAPDGAARDLVDRVVEAGRRFSARTGGGEAVVPIILDGENAWEHFEAGGRPFLRALYRLLSDHPELRTVTMEEASRNGAPLARLAAGSWVDGSFHIWIGHADDHRAWGQLSRARDVYDRTASNAGESDRATAFEELLIAEGSDWFWWYGDSHSSEHDLEFDELFRRHVQNVYRALGVPIPEDLFTSNISARDPWADTRAPEGPVRPILDGRQTTQSEWNGAGSLVLRTAFGTMHRVSSDSSGLVSGVRFGSDGETLYIRVDTPRSAGDMFAEGISVRFSVVRPLRRVYEVTYARHVAVVSSWMEQAGAQVQSATRAAGAVDEIVEMAIPLSELASDSNDPIGFFVVIVRGREELERHPTRGPANLAIPVCGAV